MISKQTISTCTVCMLQCDVISWCVKEVSNACFAMLLDKASCV